MRTSESPVSVEAFFDHLSLWASPPATAGPARRQQSLDFVVSWAECSQPMQTRLRRLMLDILSPRLIRKSDHAYSPPFRFQITMRQQFVLARPDETHALGFGGAGLD